MQSNKVIIFLTTKKNNDKIFLIVFN